MFRLLSPVQVATLGTTTLDTSYIHKGREGGVRYDKAALGSISDDPHQTVSLRCSQLLYRLLNTFSLLIY